MDINAYVADHVMRHLTHARQSNLRQLCYMEWVKKYGQSEADKIVTLVEKEWTKKGLPGAPFPLAGLLSKTATTGESNAHLSDRKKRRP